jgi:hypothetical protein
MLLTWDIAGIPAQAKERHNSKAIGEYSEDELSAEDSDDEPIFIGGSGGSEGQRQLLVWHYRSLCGGVGPERLEAAASNLGSVGVAVKQQHPAIQVCCCAVSQHAAVLSCPVQGTLTCGT